MAVYLDRDAGRTTTVPRNFNDWLYRTGYYHYEIRDVSRYDLHRQEYRDNFRAYYREHREERIAKTKAWREKHRARYNKYMREYMAKYRGKR